jgi:hypothetical protein
MNSAESLSLKYGLRNFDRYKRIPAMTANPATLFALIIVALFIGNSKIGYSSRVSYPPETPNHQVDSPGR